MTQALLINPRTISLQPNKSQWSAKPDGAGGYKLEYKPTSFSEQCRARLDTAEGGPFRFLQLGDRICKFATAIGLGRFVGNASDVFLKGWTATIIPRLPGAFDSAKKAVADLKTTSTIPGYFGRKCVGAIHEVSGFVAAVGYAASSFMFLSSKTANTGAQVLRAADSATFVGDICDTKENMEDAVKARSLANRAVALNAGADVVKTLQETAKYHLLKTMKAICSVAGYVLGLGLAAFGVATLPACVVLASSISLLSTIFAASAGLYKEGMQYKPVDFYDSKQVQYVAADALQQSAAPAPAPAPVVNKSFFGRASA